MASTSPEPDHELAPAARAEGDGLLDALRAENDELRRRIAELEASRDEYRRQMSEVLTSASWRVTAPLRGAAGKVRLGRRRVRQLPRTLARGRAPAKTSTYGLFPPGTRHEGSGYQTEPSPLLGQPLDHTARLPRPEPQPLRTGRRVLVVAHVFYPEVWPDIEDRLSRLPEDYDLVVTLVRGRAEALESRITSRLPRARIHLVENHGRDSRPLNHLARLGIFDDDYDAVLKIHTKRSLHRLDGDAWRVMLLDGVLPSPQGVDRILELFRKDPNVGLVVPAGAVRGSETWGSNQELVAALSARFPFAFDPDQLEYPAGSMYWANPFILRRLADLEIGPHHFEPEAEHLDGSSAHAIERFIGVVCNASGLDIVETADVPSRLHKARSHRRKRPNVLAFYLPQFHTNPENDAWWGEGFTDWVNVDRAKPLYKGHRQPIEPGELGRYDLAEPKVLAAQAELAQEYGVTGFVMYHYWFDGKPLLDTPLRNLLDDPDIEFPFALCWANETWTRRWDGLDKDVLIAQTYAPGWVDGYYDSIAPALADSRYIRVDGKPLLVVYRAGQLPDGGSAIRRWRERAAQDGLEGLHVLAVTPTRDFEGIPADTLRELDGLVRFPPGSGIGLQSVAHLAPGLDPEHDGDIYSYDAAIDGADLDVTGPQGLPVYPGVMPGWDNTARRGRSAYVFHGGNPVSFRRWVTRASEAAAKLDEPMIFVNAWNEWAEGAYLEPDTRFGRANLEAIRSVLGVGVRQP